MLLYKAKIKHFDDIRNNCFTDLYYRRTNHPCTIEATDMREDMFNLCAEITNPIKDIYEIKQ
jgi:hypothetical protein